MQNDKDEELIVAEALQKLRQDSSLLGRVTKPLISSVKGRLWVQSTTPSGAVSEPAPSNTPADQVALELTQSNAREDSPPSQSDVDRPSAQISSNTTPERPGEGRWKSVLLTATSLVLTVEKRKKLRHLLGLLRLANKQLSSKIDALKKAVAAENEGVTPELSADAIRQDIATTVRKCLMAISTFAAGALPEVARGAVRERMLALPARWARCSATTAGGGQSAALQLATDSLEMIRNVTDIVSSVLDRADAWCANLGKRTRDDISEDEKDLHCTSDFSRQSSVESCITLTEIPFKEDYSHSRKASRVDNDVIHYTDDDNEASSIPNVPNS